MNMINFGKYKNLPLRIEKIKDIKFDGNHPNGYNVGLVLENYYINIDLSKKHNCLFVTYSDRWFHTSAIKKQEEYEGYDLLYTLNSIYKITPTFTGITGVQEKYSITI